MSIKSEIRSRKSELLNIPAVILAGGLGTRLQPVISDLPKPMAPINGEPFLHYVFEYLKKQGIAEVILSVGYKGELIHSFFGEEYMGIEIEYSIEKEPLGTGGGIKKAFELVEDFAFVLNGDTLFDVDLVELKDFYFAKDSDITLSLKQLQNFERYGTVQMDAESRIIKFEEKKFVEQGLINGGVYFFSEELFERIETEEKFSFEKDVLEKYTSELQFHGKTFNNYFIDIGIPEDYEKAQHDFK